MIESEGRCHRRTQPLDPLLLCVRTTWERHIVWGWASARDPIKHDLSSSSNLSSKPSKAKAKHSLSTLLLNTQCSARSSSLSSLFSSSTLQLSLPPKTRAALKTPAAALSATQCTSPPSYRLIQATNVRAAIVVPGPAGRTLVTQISAFPTPRPLSSLLDLGRLVLLASALRTEGASE